MQLRGLLPASLIALGMTIAGAAHASSIIVNGSFEDTTNFTDNTGQDTMRVPVGNSTDMLGWTVTGQSLRTNDIGWIGPTNPFGLTASNGSYLLDLTGYQDGGPYGGVEQTLSTTAGHLYSVSFDVGNANGGAVTMTASAAGTSQSYTANGNFASGSGWTNYNFQFVASNPSTLLSLIATSQNYLIYAGLDNVTATDLGAVGATPIPGTLPLLASGLAGLGLFVRRRRKEAAN